MDNYRDYIFELLKSYKCLNQYETVKYIPFYDEKGVIKGFLRPITKDYRITINNCAEMLGKWRVENPSGFLSYFDIKVEKTEKWLDEHIISSNDIILFLICDLNHVYLGHMGYENIDCNERTAEIGYVLRGEKKLLPGAMTFALRSLLIWGKQVAMFKKISLCTYFDNYKAVSLYERVGFIKKGMVTLKQIKEGDKTSWIPCENYDINDLKKYNIVMEYIG